MIKIVIDEILDTKFFFELINKVQVKIIIEKISMWMEKVKLNISSCSCDELDLIEEVFFVQIFLFYIEYRSNPSLIFICIHFRTWWRRAYFARNSLIVCFTLLLNRECVRRIDIWLECIEKDMLCTCPTMNNRRRSPLTLINWDANKPRKKPYSPNDDNSICWINSSDWFIQIIIERDDLRSIWRSSWTSLLLEPKREEIEWKEEVVHEDRSTLSFNRWCLVIFIDYVLQRIIFLYRKVKKVICVTEFKQRHPYRWQQDQMIPSMRDDYQHQRLMDHLLLLHHKLLHKPVLHESFQFDHNYYLTSSNWYNETSKNAKFLLKLVRFPLLFSFLSINSLHEEIFLCRHCLSCSTTKEHQSVL